MKVLLENEGTQVAKTSTSLRSSACQPAHPWVSVPLKMPSPPLRSLSLPPSAHLSSFAPNNLPVKRIKWEEAVKSTSWLDNAG